MIFGLIGKGTVNHAPQESVRGAHPSPRPWAQ